MANEGRCDQSGGLSGANDGVCGRKLGCRTSSLSSTPFPIVESWAVPARWIPAVMAPFLGLFGLLVINQRPEYCTRLEIKFGHGEILMFFSAALADSGADLLTNPEARPQSRESRRRMGQESKLR
jgi:hypothetical protein